jgi:hypothetical protein
MNASKSLMGVVVAAVAVAATVCVASVARRWFSFDHG